MTPYRITNAICPAKLHSSRLKIVDGNDNRLLKLFALILDESSIITRKKWTSSSALRFIEFSLDNGARNYDPWDVSTLFYVVLSVLRITDEEIRRVEARARISGPADIYVKTGSLLTLTCLMSQGPHDLGTVAWYRGSQPVVTSPRSENDIDSEPRITVETEWSDALTSRLRITHAKPSDSGNYSCVPTVAEKASVNVHVINGEHPAAMQHGNTAAGTPTSKTVLAMLAFFLGQLR
ncbi:hypothetical protein KM043_012069 [Ampulex compressa]|nr:hypothetical protein KM043_012069 [Ampulex compressa]